MFSASMVMILVVTVVIAQLVFRFSEEMKYLLVKIAWAIGMVVGLVYALVLFRQKWKSIPDLILYSIIILIFLGMLCFIFYGVLPPSM
jgi:hypothetical protein